jgi:hypothetical protein
MSSHILFACRDLRRVKHGCPTTCSIRCGIALPIYSSCASGLVRLVGTLITRKKQRRSTVFSRVHEQCAKVSYASVVGRSHHTLSSGVSLSRSSRPLWSTACASIDEYGSRCSKTSSWRWSLSERTLSGCVGFIQRLDTRTAHGRCGRCESINNVLKHVALKCTCRRCGGEMFTIPRQGEQSETLAFCTLSLVRPKS